jgi:hypothetical protein
MEMGAMELRELVEEASLALARLDADRLEELAASCADLRRRLDGNDGAKGETVIRQLRDASREVTVFARVLEATRANIAVVKRLRDPAETLDGYPARQGRGSIRRPCLQEAIDGND